jgi:CHAT domain-containing protein
MQFAGFKSVVGTMWAMADEDGPLLAERFYKHMFKHPGQVDCRDSAEALSKAVNVLRRKKVPFERWINFVHYGI